VSENSIILYLKGTNLYCHSFDKRSQAINWVSTLEIGIYRENEWTLSFEEYRGKEIEVSQIKS
jgi:hypothetical protein